MSTAIWWIRRDMRLADNGALASAARHGKVVPLFVWDEALLATAGPARLAFMFGNLRALDDATERAVVYRRGNPAEVVNELCGITGATTVHIAEDFSPYGRRRDEAVERVLAAHGRRLVRADTPYVIGPGTVRKDDGTPFKVFTPFYRRWLTHSWSHAEEAPVGFARFTEHSVGMPPVPEPGVELPGTGEAAAWQRFDEWVPRALGKYPTERNNPAADGTSMMSAWLRFGVVHPRQLLARLDTSAGAETFRSEIAWREFYADVLFHQPHTAWKNLQSKMDAITVDTDAAARERFAVFCRGETGFPVVDAGIRQLLATGWMHNRVRMIVASFLVKDLHLPWQWGAKFFMHHLIDADIASNNHGWQWTAGTGTDAAPYFRVFNPTSQGEKFDPTGDYVRRFVPELAGVDAKNIHLPSALGMLGPADYPAPMVDHAAERNEALLRYKKVTGQ